MKTTVLVASTLLASVAGAGVVQVDFGDTGQQTPGNVNNITHLQNPLFNLIDTAGTGTGIGIDITDVFWPGSNTTGTTTPAGDAAFIPASATRDNLFGSVTDFGGFIEPSGGFYLTGLDASGATAYDFVFFGSRTGVSDQRWTRYTATGANTGSEALNTSNNTSGVALVNGIIPGPDGRVYIDVRPDALNNNASKFYYLGFLQLTSRAIPAPASLGALGLVGILGVTRRRR